MWVNNLFSGEMPLWSEGRTFTTLQGLRLQAIRLNGKRMWTESDDSQQGRNEDMITIEGICEQLRRYNESNHTEVCLILNADTSCSLHSAVTMNRVQEFGNPHQLVMFLNKHTGVRA